MRDNAILSRPAPAHAVACSIEAGLVEKRTGVEKRSVALTLIASGRRDVKRLQSAGDDILMRIAGNPGGDERRVLKGLMSELLSHEMRDPAHAMQFCHFCDNAHA